VATVPGICDNCGAVFGAEALTGAEGRNIDLSRAKIGPCPNCGADGKVPEGTYDLIFDTLRVAREAAIEKIVFDAVIEVLEDRAAGKVTDADVMERVEATAPALAPTVKGYLAKSDPASWIAMLISILMLLQSSSAPSPPSAEEIANAIWAKDHPAHVAPADPAPADKPEMQSRDKPRGKRPAKTHGQSKQRKSRKRR
jgi:hypothetical protein